MNKSGPARIGFRAWLFLLSAFASLPMILFSVTSLAVLLESQREVEKTRLTQAAAALAGALERHLAARVSLLDAIANDDAAGNDDLPALYAYASRMVAHSPGLMSISLVDARGTILFNTLRPFGEALPHTRDPVSARRVIETGRPAVSGSFAGTISHQRVTALGVAVTVAGIRRYCLRAVTSVVELETILAQQHLPRAWNCLVLHKGMPVAALGTFPPAAQEPLDGAGKARGALPGQTARSAAPGQGGGLMETALADVGDWGWTVAVSVPEGAFILPLHRMLVKVSVAGAVCLLASLAASRWLARRLSRDMSTLAAASAALAGGPHLFGNGTIIREMGEVRACLLAARDREEQAMTDALTGIAGRARFWELAREQERKSQSDEALGLAVMFIDLDGFKRVNDRYGHDRGDWILTRTAAVVRESIRDADVAGRLGGDEFAVCLTAPRGEIGPAAAAIAERIVDRVGNLGYGIGCSIGVSVCEICSPRLERSLTLADQAMYEAKRLGKNRYVMREDTATD